MTQYSRRAETSASAALVLGAFCAYLWIFLPRFPAGGAGWGDDYGLHLPNLLAGCYAFLKSGPLAVPWFSPAQCGGVPFIADLNVAYYSLPQWASFAIGPIPAVRLTFIVFAALGAGGFFLLLHEHFRASPLAAACVSVLFLFSGFFTVRMIVGHLTFHPFTLTPWLAWAALAGSGSQRAARTPRLWPALAGGMLLAYMFHAGMVHAMPIVFIAVAVIVAVHGQLHGHRLSPWLALAAATLISLALSAQRLAAAVSLLENFPRADYTLPGFASPIDAVHIALLSLFWRPPLAEVKRLLVNVQWTQEAHEWAFGVGPAALLLLLAGAWALARRRGPGTVGRNVQQTVIWAAIAAALALPILLNWYFPSWNAFLKAQPFLGSSSTLGRWYALYVPLCALFAGLALDRATASGWLRCAIAALLVGSTVAWSAWSDISPTLDLSYDAAPIQKAWRDASSAAAVPSVTQLALQTNGLNPMDRNNAMTFGSSQLLCYQPMFGYRLERMPFGPIRPGAALADIGGGLLNVKNPACYLFPRQNGCVPGDHFRLEQRAAAERFLRYEPFSFEMSAWQSAANGITAAALVLAIVGAGLVCFSAIAKRRSR